MAQSMTEKEIISNSEHRSRYVYPRATAVSQDGLCFPGHPRTMEEKDLPSLEERAKIIKSQGALAINQIHHAGALALKQYSGIDLWHLLQKLRMQL